jgi:hypothetical protein
MKHGKSPDKKTENISLKPVVNMLRPVRIDWIIAVSVLDRLPYLHRPIIACGGNTLLIR